MLDIMFDIPSRSDIKSCTITKDVIEKKAPPVFGYRKQKEQLPPPSWATPAEPRIPAYKTGAGT